MPRPEPVKVIRDPVWNNIQIDEQALRVLETEPVQRLRYIRQLGHAYLVYPGATHTRFEHALGTYHLARRALMILRDRGELDGVDDGQLTAIRLAALLHDVGHYPFSHALEESGYPTHEDLARTRIQEEPLRSVLAAAGDPTLPANLVSLIDGSSTLALSGLISGALDLDKLEYLTRDARMTGVPYGAIDVDRLLHSITLVDHPAGGVCVGVHEKGVSALESLVFARYQMYRNVYWHHTVRAATVMFRRAVHTALREGELEVDRVARSTDETLMDDLRATSGSDIALRLATRRLYKRVLEIRGRDLPIGCGDWIAKDPHLVARVEDRLAIELGGKPGDILLDYPGKTTLVEVDLPVVTRDGTVEVPGTAIPHSRWMSLYEIGEALHRSARFLRVFASESFAVPTEALMALFERSAEELEALLATGEPVAG